MEEKQEETRRIRRRRVNVSVGILGHVDSGKTSLARALSTQFSTASLDKHPQSKLRGITLDLGFSSFTKVRRVEFGDDDEEEEEIDVCYTLVDCPGHASLIKTVLGGASIIDCMLLVVDVNKGMQTQTAECVVIGDICVRRVVVCLNKIDCMRDEGQRAKKIEQMEKKIRGALERNAKFERLDFVAVSARPGGGHDQDVTTKDAETPPLGLKKLVEVLEKRVPKERFEGVSMSSSSASGSGDGGRRFLFAVDHCFAVKGQGTVLTGTVLSGSCKVGDFVEIPHLKEEKKVKSIQIFRESTDKCSRGDRVGMCVSGLDPEDLERFLVATPNTVPTFARAVVSCEKVRLHKSPVKSKTKFHVTIGHQTVMATATFFGESLIGNSNVSGSISRGETSGNKNYTLCGAVGTLSLNDTKDNARSGEEKELSFDSERDYALADELLHKSKVKTSIVSKTDNDNNDNNKKMAKDDGSSKIIDEEEETEDEPLPPTFAKFAYLEFEKPVTAPKYALFIASKLDVPEGSNVCRLAFFGKTLLCSDSTKVETFAEDNLRLFSIKSRRGTIERVESDNRTCVCKGMFKKESDLSQFRNMFVWMDERAGGTRGHIEGSFGKTGKFKVYFEREIDAKISRRITMRFKRFLFDKGKAGRGKRNMDQTGL